MGGETSMVMAYEEASEKYPDLCEYSVRDLGLILTGMQLYNDDQALDALKAIVDHMDEALREI